MQEPAWLDHAQAMDQAWEGLEGKQLAKVRGWARATLGEAGLAAGPVFYLFSGPDFLYADAFFPNGSTYVLCGLEPAGPIPEAGRLVGQDLEPSLGQLRAALADFLSISFFRTSDLAANLEEVEFAGNLPIICILLARTGKTIRAVTPVAIDRQGRLRAGRMADDGSDDLHQGVLITFHQGQGPQQNLFYFTTDLTDYKIRQNPGFLEFCRTLGRGNSLLKSATYLLHRANFSAARTFLLDASRVLVQDDSGVPFRHFSPDAWELRLFGAYPGPIPMFTEFSQADLADIFARSEVPPLDFRFGYRHRVGESTLILAFRNPPRGPGDDPAAGVLPRGE